MYLTKPNSSKNLQKLAIESQLEGGQFLQIFGWIDFVKYVLKFIQVSYYDPTKGNWMEKNNQSNYPNLVRSIDHDAQIVSRALESKDPSFPGKQFPGIVKKSFKESPNSNNSLLHWHWTEWIEEKSFQKMCLIFFG